MSSPRIDGCAPGEVPSASGSGTMRAIAAAIGRVIEAPALGGTSEETQASITEDDTTAG